MSISTWGHKFVAIDTETTGTNFERHEITQIAAVILNGEFEPRKDVPFFNIEIKPENLTTIDEKALFKSHKTLEGLLMNGVDKDTARRMFIDWLTTHVLRNGKKAIPVAFNWIFDRDFLIQFLGLESFNECFHHRVRDVMHMLTYVSDRLEMHYYKPGFTTFTLEKCCELMHVDNMRAHDALHDAIATAQCARAIMTVMVPVLSAETEPAIATS
jgi:oligoribonuclease (3'-5' exoribonuclease)